MVGPLRASFDSSLKVQGAGLGVTGFLIAGTLLR